MAKHWDSFLSDCIPFIIKVLDVVVNIVVNGAGEAGLETSFILLVAIFTDDGLF